MKVKIISLLLIVGIISFPITACNFVDDLVQDSPLKRAMELLPDDISMFTYFNIETFRTDPDLKDYYDIAFGDDFEDYAEEEIGIYGYEIDTISTATNGFFDQWGIFEGDFNLDDFRYTMEDNGFDEDAYHDVETWSDDYEHYAVLGNMIIRVEEEDNIRSTIRLSKGSGTSMYDNEDISDVAKRLPDGIMVILIQNEAEDYLVMGTSFSKVSSDILEVKICVKYGNERRAESNLQAIEEDLENEYSIYDVRQDGEFIEVTGEIDFADFFSPGTVYTE